MVPLPDFLQPFKSQAESIVAKGLVRDIEFSGPTYQVLVIDPKTQEECWTFLQLDNLGRLKDFFCACEEGETSSPCLHLAAAFLRIYNGQTSPLHQRFRSSLWNLLCSLYSERLGDDPSLLEKVAAGHYRRTTMSGKKVFSIKANTANAKEKLTQIIEERRFETEETSLKFSNLTEEELDQWRSGRPSAQLRYELSYWSDIAHWLMQMQGEGIPYKISFEYSDEGLPNQISIKFSALTIEFQLTNSNLPLIIPGLETVDSPLKLHQASHADIDSIVYDSNSCTLQIIRKGSAKERAKSSKKVQSHEGIAIDGWTYVPEKGFYASDEKGLLNANSLSGTQVAQVLTEHTAIIQRLLKGTVLYTDPIALFYTLKFDPQWNLHIEAYAFSPGDLKVKGSCDFGTWVHVSNQGFYPISERYFDSLETVISNKDVADFVSRERGWLNAQEGFHIHPTRIEAQVAYTLSKDNWLRFTRQTLSEDGIQSGDFGSWVYVPGEGFYGKVSTPTSLPLQADIAIGPSQIPVFIRANLPDLQLVPKFFSDKHTVAKAGLEIELMEKNKVISLTPKYELYPQYQNREVRFFDDWTYVEEEGFIEMAPELRLPERYRHHIEIKDEEEIIAFIEEELEGLAPYTGHLDSKLRKPKTLQIYAHSIVKTGENAKTGYLLQLSYRTEWGAIPISQIWTALKQKQRYLFTEAGFIDLTQRRFDWIKGLHRAQIDEQNGALSLSTQELIRLHAFDPIHVQPNTRETARSIDLLNELTQFRSTELPNLQGLKSTLRPYQQLGVQWLWFLYRHGLSGLLCDEMGLGKTHQAMALMTAIYNEFKQKHAEEGVHFLIVCPTSVIYHWQDRLKEFLPHLRVCVFHGGNRRFEEFHQQYDILLTSYGIWRLEHELLSTTKFEMAIIDEIQIAKNHRSRIHGTLRHIKAPMRIGLTGTPIENRLLEMKSLFDLVLPGYMPSESEFREVFVKPIEKEEDPKRRELLNRFIKPFLLRRKKADVLLDLPEKIEEISHCDLSEEQQQLYNQTLMQSRQYLMEQLQDTNSSIPYVHIFALLSSLKQICDHPSVFFKDPTDYKKHTSGKWNLFVELFNEARESGQKVVIFSQYLAMLDIFEEFLNEHGIGYASIRGSTIKRGEEVHRFNHDPQCQVFLGSLQAAGLGLDLTAGSVVIHYDRWWNAARENQATDRVHRIGQTRGVQVFKLVTKGTFEERIDALIEKKGRLMEEVVRSDDHRFMKTFDREDLMDLLQEVGETGYVSDFEV